MAMFKLQPPMPTSQRWIQQEFDQLHYDLHKERVRNVRPSINTAPPKIYSHLEIKLKRLQLESNRLTQIENENRRLLKALVDTAQKPSSLRIRNEYEPKSLNLNKRLHSTISVVRENEKIVNRLINVKPTHSKAKLDKDWADREKLLHNISRYRHPWRNPNEIQKKQLENGDDEDFDGSLRSSLSALRGVQISRPPTILLKQVPGRQSINHRRARSTDAAVSGRRSSERVRTPVASEAEGNAEETEPEDEEKVAELDE